MPVTVREVELEGRGALEGVGREALETPPPFEPQDALEVGSEHWSHVVVVPDAGGTIHLFSLGLAALAGIGWVRCRADSVPR
jgi:hypothetical protein